jgi:phosphatidate cytidylyltransferase
MNNFLQRLLLFIVGLPLLVLLIIYSAPYEHAGWIAVVLLFSFLGTRESYALFTAVTRERDRSYPLIALLGTALLLSAYFDVLIESAVALFPLVLTADITLIFIITLLRWNTYQRQGSFLLRILSRTMSLLYPSFFAAFLVLFSTLESAHHLILLFLILNFGNDTSAYLTGRFLARRGGPPLIAVSPNKTLIGFVGGFAGSLLGGSIYLLAVPQLLEGSFFGYLPFFFAVALLGNIGDLLESALKRSAAIKDSGNLIPGRGGVLDSIDSLLFSAPFFYYSIVIFFT